MSPFKTSKCQMCGILFSQTNQFSYDPFCQGCLKDAESKFTVYYSAFKRGRGGLFLGEYPSYIKASIGDGSVRSWAFDTDAETEAVANALAHANNGYIVFLDAIDGMAHHCGHPIMDVWDRKQNSIPHAGELRG